jgi:hypothetical protein
VTMTSLEIESGLLLPLPTVAERVAKLATENIGRLSPEEVSVVGR